MLAVRGGTVVDVDGTREADVGVEDGRIVSVGDVGDADAVVEGFRADLVVLDDDPLADAEAWQHPAVVVARGAVV